MHALSALSHTTCFPFLIPLESARRSRVLRMTSAQLHFCEEKVRRCLRLPQSINCTPSSGSHHLPTQACLLKPEVARGIRHNNATSHAYILRATRHGTRERRETLEVSNDEERTSLTAVLCAQQRTQIHQRTYVKPVCVMDECACDTLTLDHLSAVELQQARQDVFGPPRVKRCCCALLLPPRICPACACAATAPVCAELSLAASRPSRASRVSLSSSFPSAACRPTATARRSSRS